MIKLKFKLVCNEYTINEFEGEDIYAYSILRDIDNTPYEMFYSIKNPEEKCGIRIYQLFFNECEYVFINDEQIWYKNRKEIIEEIKLKQKELSLDDYEKTLQLFLEEYPDAKYISAIEFTRFGKSCDCNILKKKAGAFLKNKFGEPKRIRKACYGSSDIINTNYYTIKKGN